jgi:hypothetical protein
MHLDKEGKQVILYCDFILTVVPFFCCRYCTVAIVVSSCMLRIKENENGARFK